MVARMAPDQHDRGGGDGELRQDVRRYAHNPGREYDRRYDCAGQPGIGPPDHVSPPKRGTPPRMWISLRGNGGGRHTFCANAQLARENSPIKRALLLGRHGGCSREGCYRVVALREGRSCRSNGFRSQFVLVNEMPHGGMKASGCRKDLSMLGLEDYTVGRHVMFKHA